jgi:hypothetical protein
MKNNYKFTKPHCKRCALAFYRLHLDGTMVEHHNLLTLVS